MDRVLQRLDAPRRREKKQKNHKTFKKTNKGLTCIIADISSRTSRVWRRTNPCFLSPSSAVILPLPSTCSASLPQVNLVAMTTEEETTQIHPHPPPPPSPLYFNALRCFAFGREEQGQRLRLNRHRTPSCLDALGHAPSNCKRETFQEVTKEKNL